MLTALLAELLRIRTLLVLIGVLCVALLIWFVGPYVSVAGYAPLADETARAGVILGLVLSMAASLVVRIILARRANARAIRNLLDTDGLAMLANDRSSDEVEIIRERFESSMRVLREQAIGTEAGRNYMIQLPWYMIVGPPGAGKTTILKNSGLNFPLADRMGEDPVSGIGGTRYCDWWFSEEAVLIDTAGRYTTQDVNSEVDKAAWRGFLELLRTHRPRRPINGIIVAISLADVIAGEFERKGHVEAIKRRLQELMRFFGMTMPVYVLFTKCDLISGFNEYFDELDAVGREQVWGTTFDLEEAGGRHGAAEFDKRYKALVTRLESRLMHLLHQERNINRRCRMFTFPKEFASLREPLGAFITDIFKVSRFEMRPMLRGLYFTSGTQEGTPVDRLLGAMSRSYGLAEPRRVPFSGNGKTFFIKRLLADVVFAEQELVGVNRKLERRLSAIQGLGYVTAIGIGLVLASGWILGSAQSEVRIGEAKVAIDDLDTSLKRLPQSPTVGDLLPTLNAAAGIDEIAGKGSGWLDVGGLGLAASPRLASAADRAYDDLLVSRLLPSFTRGLETRIDEDTRQATPAALDDLRSALRLYLMLGEPTRFDRPTMLAFAKADAVQLYPLDKDRQQQLIGHFSALSELLPRRVTLNEGLIASARARLTRVPQVDQIYNRLLRDGYQANLPSVDLGRTIGARSLAVAADEQAGAGLVIPGLFTRQGFYNFFLPQLPVIIADELGGDWVAGVGDQGQSQVIARQIADRYVKDYINAWQTTLMRISPMRFNDLPRGLSVLQSLAGPQSPIDALVLAVRENTDLPPPGQESNVPPPASAQPAMAVSPLTAAASKAGTAAAGAASTALVSATMGEGPWPGKTITQPFIPLIQLGTPGASGQMPALDRTRDLMSTVYGVLSGVANAPQPPVAAMQIIAGRVKDPRSQDAIAALRSEAARRPEPIRAILQGVADSSWATLLALAYQSVNQAWQQDVLPVCESAIARRYPMYADAKEEVTLSDFTDFFRPGGTLDAFFNQYLAGFTTEQRGSYVPLTIDGTRLPVSPNALAQFNRARQIREAFFPNKGPTLQVKFSVRPTFLSSNLYRSTLAVDGTDIVYRHEAPRSYDLEWPTRSDASSVSVTLTPVEGPDTRVQRTGPWALFRLISASQPRGRSDRQSFSVAGPDDALASYDLRSASVNSPFNLAALHNFRCPDEL
ncbi:type VI secretion system membrane subunit TssM [Xanthobacteraceae bacterium A53D]